MCFCPMPSLATVTQGHSLLDQAEGKLSPDGKKIPTRGVAAAKWKQDKVPLLAHIMPTHTYIIYYIVWSMGNNYVYNGRKILGDILYIIIYYENT